jgi:hypothetical protein
LTAIDSGMGIYNLDNDLAKDLIAIEKQRAEEAVFQQSFIPASLSQLGIDAFAEQKRLLTGQREPAFAAAVMNMIHTGSSKDDVVNSKDTVDQQSEVANAEDDDEDNSDASGSETESSDEENAKYRRCLPSRDDGDARQAEKQARKEARKQAKESAAAKRQNKIPKHVKKRAMKTSKR